MNTYKKLRDGHCVPQDHVKQNLRHVTLLLCMRSGIYLLHSQNLAVTHAASPHETASHFAPGLILLCEEDMAVKGVIQQLFWNNIVFFDSSRFLRIQ